MNQALDRQNDLISFQFEDENIKNKFELKFYSLLELNQYKLKKVYSFRIESDKKISEKKFFAG
jgi:hypothetical protein